MLATGIHSVGVDDGAIGKVPKVSLRCRDPFQGTATFAGCYQTPLGRNAYFGRRRQASQNVRRFGFSGSFCLMGARFRLRLNRQPQPKPGHFQQLQEGG
jgi:hypothetical protein